MINSCNTRRDFSVISINAIGAHSHLPKARLKDKTLITSVRSISYWWKLLEQSQLCIMKLLIDDPLPEATIKIYVCHKKTGLLFLGRLVADACVSFTLGCKDVCFLQTFNKIDSIFTQLSCWFWGGYTFYSKSIPALKKDTEVVTGWVGVEQSSANCGVIFETLSSPCLRWTSQAPQRWFFLAWGGKSGVIYPTYPDMVRKSG